MTTVTVYALTFDRSRQEVERLLNHFSVRRSACAAEYEYPEYSHSPECVYTDDGSILDRLETDKNASYSLYWDVVESKGDFSVEQEIVFYTDDGGVIFGVVVLEPLARSILEEFQTAFGPKWAMITGDECPPLTSLQFKDVCYNSEVPKICEGQLVT